MYHQVTIKSIRIPHPRHCNVPNVSYITINCDPPLSHSCCGLSLFFTSHGPHVTHQPTLPTLPTNHPTVKTSTHKLPLLDGIRSHWAPIDQRPKPKIQDRRGALKAPPSTSRWPEASTFDLEKPSKANSWKLLEDDFSKNSPPGKPPGALVFLFEERCFKRLWLNSTLMKPTPFNQTKKKTHQSYHRVHRPQTCWDGIELPLAHDYTRRRRSDPRQCLASFPRGESWRHSNWDKESHRNKCTRSFSQRVLSESRETMKKNKKRMSFL